MSTVAERSAARKRAQQQQQALDWADDRLGSSSWLRSAMDKIFPDHWSFMVGEIAMYSFVILIATGIYLALFYKASDAIVIYHGVYKPLDGQSMTEAYASTINISFSVRAGLVMRQAHHWAALIFLAAITFHMCRIFFTGAFRRPREINWIIGVTLLLLAMLEGFSGYSLPDDLLSGSGLRVVFSIVQSIPFVGVWLAFTVWGGNFPGTVFFRGCSSSTSSCSRYSWPACSGATWPSCGTRSTPTSPGRARPSPTSSAAGSGPSTRSSRPLCSCSLPAVIFGLGGLVQINPIWLYGPYEAARSSAGTQPDWYVGWLDGALRLWPHWEFRSFGHEMANPFFPGLLLPGIVFTVIYAWPWIDKRIYSDYGAPQPARPAARQAAPHRRRRGRPHLLHRPHAG